MLIATDKDQSQSRTHVSPSSRAESGQRKRPKYTRSKTGCVTCRSRKVRVRWSRSPSVHFHRFYSSIFNLGQCDETKPNCQRCTHREREASKLITVHSKSHWLTSAVRQCTWPEILPTRKRSRTIRKVSGWDAYESTAGSSERSGPSTQNFTPRDSYESAAGSSELSGPPTRNVTPGEDFGVALPSQPFPHTA